MFLTTGLAAIDNTKNAITVLDDPRISSSHYYKIAIIDVWILALMFSLLTIHIIHDLHFGK